MLKWIIGYFIVQIIFVLILVLLSQLKDKRLKDKHGEGVPAGFEKTEEINIDPSSGKKLTVYYNQATGERYYKEE